MNLNFTILSSRLLCVLIAFSALMAIESRAQNTVTIPVLKKQGITQRYTAGSIVYSSGDAYSVERTSATASTEITAGRYQFQHTAFTNAQILKLTLNTVARTKNSQGLFQGIAYVKKLDNGCNSANSWDFTTTAQLQGAFTCIQQGTSMFQEAISTPVGLSYQTAGWVLDHTVLDAGSTLITIGLDPIQLGIEIQSLSLTIIYSPDPPIVNNTICCDQTIMTSTSPATLIGSTPTGGKGTYTYQWQQNNGPAWTNIANAVGKDYKPGVLTTTTYYRRVVTSGTSAPSTSSNVIVTVNDPAIFGNTVCCNQTLTGTRYPAALIGSYPGGGTGTYAYQWQIGNAGTWTDIATATGIDYDPFSISETTSFRRKVSSGGAALSVSNEVQIVLIRDPAIVGNTICCDQLVTSTTVPETITGATPTGGNGDYTYKWLRKSAGDDTWRSISNSDTKDWVFTAASATKMYYKREVISGTETTYSNEIQVDVAKDPAIIGNTICCDQEVTSIATPATIIGSTPTGGNGTYSYIWLYLHESGNWVFMDQKRARNYSFWQPQSDRELRLKRMVTSGTEQSYSDEIRVSVLQDPPIGENVLCCNQDICGMSMPDDLAGSTPSGGAGVYTYKWQQKNAAGAWVDIAGATAETFNPGPISASTDYRRVVRSGNAAAVASGEIRLTVMPDNLNVNTIQYTTSTVARARFINISGEVSTSNASVVFIAGEGVSVKGTARLLPGIQIFTDPCVFPASSARQAQEEENVTGSELPSSETEIKVYPNPAHQNITVMLAGSSLELQPVALQLTSMASKTVYAGSFNNMNAVSIDVSAFSPGLYYLRIQSPTRVIYKKIIVE